MPIYGISSQTPAVWHAGAFFASIFVAFGINAILRPRAGFEQFQFKYPTMADDQKLIDNLMIIYGIRDVAMGVSMLAAWYFGAREVLAYSLISGSVVAFVDGIANRAVLGYGQGQHWSYAPMLTIVGAILLGAIDS